ncbi:MAG: hypothetical protein EU536_05075 [Promethearchaeota archaeon]|nr:MAG: hypothetical protein EU536_05075 [Candidatus Lokiarchaeota archaeon]
MARNDPALPKTTYLTKAAHGFSLSWFVFFMILYILSLFLPVDSSQGHFFALSVVIIILLSITISVTLLSLRNDAHPFYDPRMKKERIWSLPLAWIFWWFTMLIYSVPSWFGRKGIGEELFGYLLTGQYEFISLPNFLDTLAWVFAGFYVLFPWVFALFKVGSDFYYKKRISKINSLIRRIIRVLAWIWCGILTIIPLSGVILSFFLPWSASTNFFSFLSTNFNGQTAVLCVNLLLAICFIVLSTILMIAFLYFKIAKGGKGQLPEGLDRSSHRVLYCWFLAWMGIWITFAISKAYLLMAINEGVLIAEVGLVIYLTVAQFIVVLSVIMGMVTVLGHASWGSPTAIQDSSHHDHPIAVE